MSDSGHKQGQLAENNESNFMKANEFDEFTSIPLEGNEDVTGIDIQQEPEVPDIEGVNIFSVSRPKDAIDGLSKGVGNVLKGGAGAVAMMLSAPVLGAMDVYHNFTYIFNPYLSRF